MFLQHAGLVFPMQSRAQSKASHQQHSYIKSYEPHDALELGRVLFLKEDSKKRTAASLANTKIPEFF